MTMDLPRVPLLLRVVAWSTLAITTVAFVPSNTIGRFGASGLAVEQRTVGEWRRFAVDAETPSKEVTAVGIGESNDTTKQEEILQEASEKLEAVGWSLPTSGDLTSEDPFVQAIDAGIQRDVGVPLDELLNPAKVVNLERDLYALRLELAAETGVLDDAVSTTAGNEIRFQTTQECDGGGGGPETDQLREKIAKKENDLAIERRSVFRGWLKNVFLVQAVLSFGLSYVMATNPSALFGQFNWFYSYNMDISIQVLGYWWWWLFVVPSLRSRRPKGMEKKALDWAFLATPLISLLAPVATKDTGIIWTANLVVVVACYAVAYLASDGDDDGGTSSDTPEWLKFVYKSLDFGSGRERGARNN